MEEIPETGFWGKIRDFYETNNLEFPFYNSIHNPEYIHLDDHGQRKEFLKLLDKRPFVGRYGIIGKNYRGG